MKGFFYIALLACNPYFATAQTVDEVLAKMHTNYTDAKQLEYKATYELFRGHTSNEPHTVFAGYGLRDNNRAYQKIDQTVFVYTPEYTLKVNKEEKAMIISKPTAQQLLSEVDLKAVLSECKSKKVEASDDFYTVVLYVKDESSLPISLVKLKIDRKKYHLLRLDVYYTDHIDFSDTYSKVDYQAPHMRITFNEVNTHPKINEELFSLERYLKKTANGYIPTGSYAEYELGDYTNR